MCDRAIALQLKSEFLPGGVGVARQIIWPIKSLNLDLILICSLLISPFSTAQYFSHSAKNRFAIGWQRRAGKINAQQILLFRVRAEQRRRHDKGRAAFIGFGIVFHPRLH